jgi:hypothetical protein
MPVNLAAELVKMATFRVNCHRNRINSVEKAVKLNNQPARSLSDLTKSWTFLGRNQDLFPLPTSIQTGKLPLQGRKLANQTGEVTDLPFFVAELTDNVEKISDKLSELGRKDRKKPNSVTKQPCSRTKFSNKSDLLTNSNAEIPAILVFISVIFISLR